MILHCATARPPGKAGTSTNSAGSTAAVKKGVSASSVAKKNREKRQNKATNGQDIIKFAAPGSA